MIKEIEQEILNILQENPEELKHAKDTLKWLLIIKPSSDFILRISALGHDIERAVNSWELNGHIDKKLNEKGFRIAHSIRSVKTLKQIFLENSLGEDELKRMENLVLNHEFGGNEDADLIRDADSLANFEWCDDMFGKINSDDIKEIMERMYNRMCVENRKFIEMVNFRNSEVKSWII